MNNFTYHPPQHPLMVIYEDDDFIVIDKPAGLLSVMGRLPEHQDSAYLRILKEYPKAKVTHRLDMATSGLLLFAKHRQAEIAISKIFQARHIQKYYIALVSGKISNHGTIEIPLITDWPNRPKQKVDFEQGKYAKTCYKRIEYDQNKQCSRVLLEPITGRSHQLRVHMQYVGHPILGDRFYHPEPSSFYLNRMALHATQLILNHPLTGHILDLKSEPDF